MAFCPRRNSTSKAISRKIGKHLKQMWSNYAAIMNIGSQSQQYQVALFIHCIGPSGLRRIRTKHRYNSRNQAPSESTDAYLASVNMERLWMYAIELSLVLCLYIGVAPTTWSVILMSRVLWCTTRGVDHERQIINLSYRVLWFCGPSYLTDATLGAWNVQTRKKLLQH